MSPGWRDHLVTHSRTRILYDYLMDTKAASSQFDRMHSIGYPGEWWLQVSVQDTVGCGDSFAAGIVLGFIQKQPLRPVLALSNAVGAATATSPGAGRNVASADTVRSLLSRQAGTSDSSGTRLLASIHVSTMGWVHAI
jgi:hypothetical protein